MPIVTPKYLPSLSSYMLHTEFAPGAKLSHDQLGRIMLIHYDATWHAVDFGDRRVEGFAFDDCVYGVHQEKRRAKYRHTGKMIPSRLDIDRSVPESVLQSPAGWVFSIYLFPASVIRTMVQGDRSFEVSFR